MCDRWRDDFAAFLEDMGPRPSPQHTIERIKNERGYSKDNCKWALWDEQQNNKTTNHVIEHDGVRRNISQWAEHLGFKYHRLFYLLMARGLSIPEAVAYKPQKRGPKPSQ